MYTHKSDRAVCCSSCRHRVWCGNSSDFLYGVTPRSMIRTVSFHLPPHSPSHHRPPLKNTVKMKNKKEWGVEWGVKLLYTISVNLVVKRNHLQLCICICVQHLPSGSYPRPLLIHPPLSSWSSILTGSWLCIPSPLISRYIHTIILSARICKACLQLPSPPPSSLAPGLILWSIQCTTSFLKYTAKYNYSGHITTTLAALSEWKKRRDAHTHADLKERVNQKLVLNVCVLSPSPTYLNG